MSEDSKKDDCGGDYVVAGPKLADGRNTVIRHRPNHTIELAEIRPIEDGKPLPIDGEMVNISGEGPVYKVEPIYKSEPSQGTARKGPARVSSRKYKTGWDNIFGKKNLN